MWPTREQTKQTHTQRMSKPKPNMSDAMLTDDDEEDSSGAEKRRPFGAVKTDSARRIYEKTNDSYDAENSKVT